MRRAGWAVAVAMVMAAGCEAGGPLVDERGPDDEVEPRDDGCGAGLHKRQVEQKCTYTANPNPTAAIGSSATCKGTDALECEFVYTGCGWISISESVCHSEEPACPAQAPLKITKKHTYTLPLGDKYCEPKPPAPASEVTPRGVVLVSTKCKDLGNTVKIGGKTMPELLIDECKKKGSFTHVPKLVECCVEKPGGTATSTGGESSGDAPSTGLESSPGETSAEATSVGETTWFSETTWFGEATSVGEATSAGDGGTTWTTIEAPPLPPG